MRHGRRADLARLGALSEIAKRNVAPGIAREIDEYGVGTGISIEQLGHRIMRLDLYRVRIEFDAESLDKTARERFPIDLRVGGYVRVVIADSAIHLSRNQYLCDAIARAMQSPDDVRQLLAQCRRTRCLAVRMREHRQISEVMRKRGQALHDRVERGQHHAHTRFLEHQRMTKVVDVFGGAREMNELGDCCDLRIPGELLL